MTGVMWRKINKSAFDKVIIVGSGPSLGGFDFNRLKNKNAFVIAINDVGKHIPFANAWFTIDPWGIIQPSQQLPKPFYGEYFAAVPEDFGLPDARSRAHAGNAPHDVKYLRRLQFHTCSNIPLIEYSLWGLSEDNSCIHTGNSGYGALNFRYHMRPKKILLLGIDGTQGYFYDKNKATRTLRHLPTMFKSRIPQLERENIQVINGSPISTITCFPRFSIDASLEAF